MLWRTQKPKLKHSPLVNVSEPWVSFTIPELTERNHVYKRTAIKGLNARTMEANLSSPKNDQEHRTALVAQG